MIEETKLSNGVHVLSTGHGSPVVLLHGLGGNAQLWSRQFAVLSKHYQAVAWDMPGFGKSDPLHDLTFGALVSKLHETMRLLGLHRPILVGHAMGGMVALEYAVKHPQVPVALVLYSTSPGFAQRGAQFQEMLRRAHFKPLEEGQSVRQMADTFIQAQTSPKADAAGVRHATEAMASMPEAAYRAAVECMVHFDERESLPALPMPVLALGGAEDKTPAPSALKEMAERIPRGRYEAIEGAGHVAHVEQPDAFNKALMRFIDHLKLPGV